LIIVAGTFEAFLIFAAALASIGFDLQASAPVEQLYAMIVLTSLSMGLRNATVRQLHVADSTTTVFYPHTDRLGRGLVGGRRQQPAARTADLFDSCALSRCALWCLSVAYGVALPLFITGACVLLITAAYAVIAEIGLQRHSSSKSLESYERSVQRNSVVDTILVRDLSSTGISATR
jgi:uncharacterized membrane protein YoaK (UPF0700 family)